MTWQLPIGMGTLPSFAHLICGESLSITSSNALCLSQLILETLSHSALKGITFQCCYIQEGRKRRQKDPQLSNAITVDYKVRVFMQLFITQTPLIILSEDCKRETLMAGNAKVKIFSMLWTTLWKDTFLSGQYYTRCLLLSSKQYEFVQKLTLLCPERKME